MDFEHQYRSARRLPWVTGGVIAGALGALLLAGSWSFARGTLRLAEAKPQQAPVAAQTAPIVQTPSTSSSSSSQPPAQVQSARGALPDFTALVERFGPAVVNISVTGTIKTAGGSPVPGDAGFRTR